MGTGIGIGIGMPFIRGGSGGGVPFQGPAWCTAGGVSSSNVLAVYQPIGAADYAASKINLAYPGIHDLTDGIVPTFNAVDGWTFDGATNYLSTDLTTVDIGRGTGSVIIRGSGLLNDLKQHGIFGSTNYIPLTNEEVAYQIWTKRVGWQNRLYLGGFAHSCDYDVYTPAESAKYGTYTDPFVIGLVGLEILLTNHLFTTWQYADGWYAPVNMDTPEFYIGAIVYYDNGAVISYVDYYPGKIQAIAIYDTVISSAQFNAISAAMLAL